jgi:UDP-galactopyranose mutase
MWNVITPGQAVEKIKSQISKIHNPKNLEEFALSTVGKDIYDKLIKGYTMKQWGTDPKNLPVSIIKRIPLRFRYDNNYFNDTYQGIPIGGYTNLVKNILSDVEVRLNTDYLSDRDYFNSLAKNIVYTGKIDEFFDYQFGELKYRSLRFETETLDVSDYQGVAGMNFTDQDTPYTRIIEHKHFDLLKETKSTIITKEFPKKYESSDIPYYPVNDEVNNKIYHKYKELSTNYPNIIFGGRLAEYKYYDMHQIIGSALSKAEKILKLK